MRSPAIVEPHGTGELMPAILVGFANPPGNSLRWDDLRSDCPPYVVEVLQQAGGYATYHPDGVGVLLRLAANAERSLQDPSRLIRGFHSMADDQNFAVLRRDYPALAALCGTNGENYKPEELRVLDSELSAFFRLPTAARGLEAFVEFAGCDIVSFFGGWQMVEVSTDVERIEAEQRTYGELWSDGAKLTADVLGELVGLGRFCGIDQPITSVLLWENSD